MHDIFNHEDEISNIKDKLQTRKMESDDYDKCTDIFTILNTTAQTIADDLRGQKEVKDAPVTYFEQFQLGTKLHKLQKDIKEIITICNKLKYTSYNNRESELYDNLDKYVASTISYLTHIKQTLPPSTKKPVRKKKSKAEKRKGEKAQESMENNEIEQERYPWFSTTTLG